MRKLIFLFLFLLAVSFSSAGLVGSDSGKIPAKCDAKNCQIGAASNSCGNGIVEEHFGEQCDGKNLAGMSCESLLGSEFTGKLGCKSSCSWDTSSCRKKEPAGESGGSSNGKSSSSKSESGSSGSSGSSSCIEDWSCSDWGNCVGNSQSRTCTDLSSCGTMKTKPITERSCFSEDFELGSESGGLLGLTGAAVSVLKKPGSVWVLLVVLIVGFLMWEKSKSKKKKNSKKKKSGKKKAGKK